MASLTLPTVYLLCGLPFSGKTTLAQTLAQRCGFVHVDVDGMARDKGLRPDQGISEVLWAQVFDAAYQRLLTLLASGKSVLFDAVNYDRKGREHIRSLVQPSGNPVRVIYVVAPMADIERRREESQRRSERAGVRDEDLQWLIDKFEAPTTDEDVIVYDGSVSAEEWINRWLAACRREMQKTLFSAISRIGQGRFSAGKLLTPTNC
jgi:predicted kinase